MAETELDVQRHGIMLLGSSAGITLVGFLATIFYAHWIGADILGQYFLFVSVLSILSLFCDLGIGYATTFRICEGIDPERYFSAGLVIRLGLFALVTLVLTVFGGYFGNLNANTLFWTLIAVLFLTTLTSTISLAIGASNRLGLAASVSLLNNITRICTQVLAIFLGFQVYGLIGGMVAGLLLELVISLRYVDYHIVRFKQENVRKIFSFSTWAFLSTACTTLFDNANLLIISYFLTISDVGIFGVCWTFSFFALFISTALCNTLFVKVSRWNTSGDKNAITIAFSRATSYALVLALPMLVGGALLGKNILYYLYGSSFALGATALIIIIGVRVVQSIFQLYSNFLMATDHVKHQFIGLCAGITINIILSVILIPLLGLPGAAIASLANVLVSTIICAYFLQKIIPIHIDIDSIRDIIIATIAMTVALLGAGMLHLNESLFTTATLIAFGALVYCITLLSINAQIRKDTANTLKIRWIQ